MKRHIVIRIISFALLLACGLEMYFNNEESLFTRHELALIGLFILCLATLLEVATLVLELKEKRMDKNAMVQKIKRFLISFLMILGIIGLSLVFIDGKGQIFSGDTLLFTLVYTASFGGILLAIVLFFMWKLEQ